MSHTQTEQAQPLVLSIPNATKFCGGVISRTRLYDLANAGQIEAVRVGRRTGIVTRSLQEFIERLPRVAA